MRLLADRRMFQCAMCGSQRSGIHGHGTIFDLIIILYCPPSRVLKSPDQTYQTETPIEVLSRRMPPVTAS